MTDKKKTDPQRSNDGKFKKAAVPEDPAAEKLLGDHPQEEKPRPLLPVRVTGAGTKSAKLQTHNLKWNEAGEPLPELSEGVEEDE